MFLRTFDMAAGKKAGSEGKAHLALGRAPEVL